LLAGLIAELGQRGVALVATREPGGTPFGNLLRAAFVNPNVAVDPIAEALVVNASRAQHVADVIEPALARGATVLCDRFADATLAYQGYGRGVDRALLRSLAQIATRGREPDLTLLVDVPIATSRERVAARAHETGVKIDRLEREDDGFHERVRDGYLALAREFPDRVEVLDGTRTPHVLLCAALAAIDERLPG
jgi:dTMP kinase